MIVKAVSASENHIIDGTTCLVEPPRGILGRTALPPYSSSNVSGTTLHGGCRSVGVSMCSLTNSMVQGARKEMCRGTLARNGPRVSSARGLHENDACS